MKKTFGNKDSMIQGFKFKDAFKEIEVEHEDEVYGFFIRKINLGDRTEFSKFVANNQKVKALNVDGDTPDMAFALDSTFMLLVMGLADEEGNQMFKDKDELLSSLQSLEQDVVAKIVNEIMEYNGFGAKAVPEAVKNSEAVQN